MICREIIVPPESDGLTVSAFLRLVLPGLSESDLRRLFEKKDVRLENVRITRDVRLPAGGHIRVYLPSEASSESLKIVYEDRDVLLVNKRAGLSVDPDEGGGVSLTSLVREYTHTPDSPFPAPCHRLDHQTCGLCLFARHEEALQVLTDVFRRRTADKRYECLVRGIMKPPAATCRAYLLKHAEEAFVTVTDRPVPGSKVILTAYETLQAGPVSRLRVHLITGRTHQIRAHMAALGHPILGDDLYGDRSLNRANKTRALRLCSVSLTLDTGGRLPALDHRTFRIDPPF